MDEEDHNTSNYVKLFQNHLNQFNDHLSGTIRYDGVLYPSYFPPCSHWTSEEKNRFFHALSIYSKLRPDLIAEAIPGKTVIDVLLYLDLLDSAAATGTSQKLARATFETAVEVSDKWVKYEEKEAGIIAEKEQEWEQEYYDGRRLAILQTMEGEIRSSIAKAEGKGRMKEDLRRIKQEIKQLHAEMDKKWLKEDYLKELSGPHLRAIDHIFREAEEPTESREPQEQEAVRRGPDPPQADIPGANVVPDSAIDPVLLALSRPIMPGPTPPSYHGQAVDVPPLVSSASPALPLQSPAPTQLGRSRSVSPQDELGLSVRALAALSPRSRRKHQKRLYMRRKRAEATGGSVSASVTRLKPGRKTNKKLERQIAKAKERKEREFAPLTEIPDGDGMNVDLDVAGFTIPAEETKEEYLDVTAGKEEYEVSLQKLESDNSDDDESKDGDHRHRNVGGTTLHYKIIQDLTDMGYNANNIEVDSLGLFHLTNLHKIMGLHASLRSVADNVGTCISASTIRLLHAHVSYFVYILIQKTIALREQERKSKVHTKVWRLKDNIIKPSSVIEALQTMGAEKDKKAFFSSLVGRFACLDETIARTEERREMEKEAQVNEAQAEIVNEDSVEVSGTSDSDDDEDTEDQEDQEYSEDEDSLDFLQRPLPSLPAHIELNQPFIRHPALDYLLPNPYQTGSIEEDESTLLPEELDATKLLEEMLEEEDLDALDMEMARQEESDLWRRMRKRKRSETDVPETEILNARSPVPEGKTKIGGRQTRSGRTAKQFEKPNPSRGIKSTVFVDDSD